MGFGVFFIAGVERKEQENKATGFYSSDATQEAQKSKPTPSHNTFFFFQNIFKNVLFKWIQTFLPLLILTFLLEGEVFCEVPALVVPSKEEQRFGMIYL